ncbi:hypothetical protein [Streptomyces bikiniensis]|uniref:hypothetical protein n=1 Tax=Streptomyces bikiniensis TaxID=1896 RepID=UPI000AC45547|nr:hypothetical protein [Streptomyces bikiniensis]
MKTDVDERRREFGTEYGTHDTYIADVFAPPAEDLFRRAAERGRTVDTTEPEYPFVPGVSLGFTRRTIQEVPRTAQGLPVRVTSVLVAGEHSHDRCPGRDPGPVDGAPGACGGGRPRGRRAR